MMQWTINGKKGDGPSLRLLLIEDDQDDALLIRRYLAMRSGISYEVLHADRLQSGLASLKDGGPDIVLLDLGLPDGDGLSTFQRIHAAAPQVPVIVLTGRDDDDLALGAVQRGAQDFLPKDKVSADLLNRSIRYAIERQKLLTQIETSKKEIKTLRGFLPICASCKKVRDDRGYWTQIEAYITARSDVEFSHGLCLECAKKLYPSIQMPEDADAPS